MDEYNNISFKGSNVIQQEKSVKSYFKNKNIQAFLVKKYGEVYGDSKVRVN